MNQAYHAPFQLGPDATPYRKLTSEGVRVEQALGREIVVVDSEALRLLSEQAMIDINHLLRPGHLKQLAQILDDPEATAATWVDGWLRTGDIGRLDEDGYLYIGGRVKDVIIRGGSNIYAIDVENVLLAHPAVAEVAVIGVPHDVLGEDLAAIVVVRPGRGVGAEAQSVRGVYRYLVKRYGTV